MINVLSVYKDSLYPIVEELSQIKIGLKTIAQEIVDLFPANCDKEISVRADFMPSSKMVELLSNATVNTKIVDVENQETLAKLEFDNQDFKTIICDDESLLIVYPWDLLSLNEKMVGAISENIVEGIVRENVTIDGHIVLGKNSVILPGVYIEGNVVIGENCKIGPNAYIRGNCTFGDKAHIGQAVEVKNSIFLDNVSAGHLSYIGDSIVCCKVNFGAGTKISNFRHDGKNHNFMVDGKLISTNRRKFGAIIGNNVHTGIGTLIYPGRFLPPESSTLPGDIIKGTSKKVF